LNSIGVESVTDATKDEKGMYSLNVTAKGGYTPEKGYTHLFLDKDNKVETIKPGFPRYVTSHLTAFPQLSIFRSSQQRYNP
jgi:hypothetical protein